jgi:FkbM family methyltransferase
MRRHLGGFIRRAVSALGYDIRRRPPSAAERICDFLRQQRVDLVIDVGANAGQFVQDLRQSGYQGGVVSFEPVAEAFAALAARAGGDPRWTAHHLALGASNTSAELAVTRFNLLSSFVTPTVLRSELGAAAEIVRTDAVAMARLDDAMPPSENVRTFLKVDTEGYERQVLQGAPRILSSARGVMLELPIVALYRDCWSFEAALAHMKATGFVLHEIHPLAHDVDGAWLQVDCVFRRRDERDDETAVEQVNA